MKKKAVKKKKLTLKERRLKLAKQTVKFNKIFSKAKPAEKRVMIAKDIIAQLEAKKFIAETGKYINISIPREVEYDAGIRENFDKIEECKVCALGACMMSTTKFNNKLTFDDVGTSITDFDGKSGDLLTELFTPKQLLLIENAFEGYYVTADRFAIDVLKQNDLSKADIKKCNDFFTKHGGTFDKEDGTPNMYAKEKIVDERLQAIMNNIIKNKGTFKL